MTRDKAISKLLNDDVDCIQQWVLDGHYELLFDWMKEIMAYDKKSDEDILQDLQTRGMIGLDTKSL